jgi:iron complex transport system substrate-binding protein
MRTPQRLSAAVLVAVAAAAALAGCSSASSSTASTASTASVAGTAAAASALAPASPTPTTTLIPHWPVTVTAANGAVKIKSLPQRIVSLDPTATADLYAVGAGTQVVAVDQDSDFPPGVPVTSLSGLSPNVEAIAKYHPSLVIAARDSNGLVSGLNKLGIPVLIEPGPSTLARVYQQIEQIGLATGHANQAGEVVTNMREEITDIVQQAGTKYQGLTYYWERSSGPYRSATSATLVGNIMAMFGLRNIADAASKTGGDYPELSGDYIIAARPQFIFLADNGAAEGGQTPAMVAARRGWAGIPAVKDHDVIGLNGDIASGWGPRLPELVEEIASALKSFKS